MGLIDIIDPPCVTPLASEEKMRDCRRWLGKISATLVLSEERQRREIAENLHDHLGQALALMRIRLKELRGNAVFCGLDQNIDDMTSLVEQAIRYTRSLTFELSPPVLHELGIEPALEWLTEFFARKYHLPVRFIGTGGAPRPAADGEVMLFRSTRELLFNVLKHASAQNTTVTASTAPDRFEIAVEDDGSGFPDPEVVPSAKNDDAGFGLRSIRDQMHHLGGTLKIDSAPGRGTRVILSIPSPGCVEDRHDC